MESQFNLKIKKLISKKKINYNKILKTYVNNWEKTGDLGLNENVLNHIGYTEDNIDKDDAGLITLFGILKYHKAKNPDYKKAFKCYENGAKTNDPIALNMLGFMYHCGKGLVQDNEKAMKLYLKSAEQNCGVAMANIAGEYIDQNPPQYKEAIHWFKRAAENGYVDAKFNLGKLYLEGAHVDVDYNLGMTYMTQAADEGCDEANNFLGSIWGSLEHNDKAQMYFKRSANNGDLDALVELGALHAQDDNDEEAIKLYEQAVEKDNEYGLNNLINLLIRDRELMKTYLKEKLKN
jgi:TPR repeat protein